MKNLFVKLPLLSTYLFIIGCALIFLCISLFLPRVFAQTSGDVIAPIEMSAEVASIMATSSIDVNTASKIVADKENTDLVVSRLDSLIRINNLILNEIRRIK